MLVDNCVVLAINLSKQNKSNIFTQKRFTHKLSLDLVSFHVKFNCFKHHIHTTLNLLLYCSSTSNVGIVPGPFIYLAYNVLKGACNVHMLLQQFALLPYVHK